MCEKTLKIMINTPSKTYPVYYGEDFSGISEALKERGLAGVKYCVVTDTNVAPLYLAAFREVVEGICSEYSEVIFPAGEENKTLGTIETFYNAFVRGRIDRKSVVIALGGGVTGDMAGFAAATYMRGIRYVQVPTTLLAQVDSSVGGKTGVDFGGVKNVIGAFHQPELVYVNVRALDTLPTSHFSSGMAEAIKHGLICDRNYYEFIALNADKIIAHDFYSTSLLISGSCKIKAGVVSSDEKESEGGRRGLLNFGHTFGHAIESLCGYMLPHGHCVAIGMNAAFAMSCLSDAEIEGAVGLMHKFGLPTEIPIEMREFSREKMYDRMFLDKKTNNNEINAIVLNGIGNAEILKDVPMERIFKAIKRVYI